MEGNARPDRSQKLRKLTAGMNQPGGVIVSITWDHALYGGIGHEYYNKRSAWH